MNDKPRVGHFPFGGGNRPTDGCAGTDGSGRSERSERSGDTLGAHVTLNPGETAETPHVTEMSTRMPWRHDINDNVYNDNVQFCAAPAQPLPDLLATNDDVLPSQRRSSRPQNEKGPNSCVVADTHSPRRRRRRHRLCMY